MARAASIYDNDYARVFESYEGPRFGFASKNYYSEFLAAIQVYANFGPSPASQDAMAITALALYLALAVLAALVERIAAVPAEARPAPQ